jgi:hypothetical protein
MFSTVLDRVTEHVTTQEPSSCAHIVVTDEGTIATALILAARIYGTPITALCGYVFVPQKDPTVLPVCPACKDIYDTMRVFDGNLFETPKA